MIAELIPPTMHEPPHLPFLAIIGIIASNETLSISLVSLSDSGRSLWQILLYEIGYHCVSLQLDLWNKNRSCIVECLRTLDKLLISTTQNSFWISQDKQPQCQSFRSADILSFCSEHLSRGSFDVTTTDVSYLRYFHSNWE